MPDDSPSYLGSLLSESNPFDPTHTGRQAMLGNALTYGLPAAALGAGAGALFGGKKRRLRGAGIGALTGLLGVGGTAGLVGRHQARGQSNALLDQATAMYQNTFTSPDLTEDYDPEYAAFDPTKDVSFLRDLYGQAHDSTERQGLSPRSSQKFQDDLDQVSRRLPNVSLDASPLRDHSLRATQARDDHFRQTLRDVRLPHEAWEDPGATDQLVEKTMHTLAPSHRQSPSADYARHLAKTYGRRYRPSL